MKFYEGKSSRFVTVDGQPLPTATHIVNHSPGGFAWGYYGSGAAQLALAVMVSEYGVDLDDHPVHYQRFKEACIANLDSAEFSFNSDNVKQVVALIEMSVE